MDPGMVMDAPAHRRRARVLAARPGLAGVLAAVLAWPAEVPAQQQLPSRPIANVPEKKSGLQGVLDQITPRLPKGYDAQKTPLDTPWIDIAPASPQPVPCAAFKGSAEDMNALRKTAREAAARRTITPLDFEASVPKACAGQEWAFYLLFLSNVGQGKL